jgi:hypothetical protein
MSVECLFSMTPCLDAARRLPRGQALAPEVLDSGDGPGLGRHNYSGFRNKRLRLS